MSVRAKFRVESVTSTVNGKSVVLIPVMSGSEENLRFWKYTPSGKIEMYTVNEDASGQFGPGDEWYIDFTKAPRTTAL